MLSEKLRNAIADLILSGEYQPGARLDEQTLADRFDVSRTPVREALHQLAVSGLVLQRPRRPAIVSQMSPDQLADAFEAMGEIEAISARYAAERMTQAERLMLRDLMSRADIVVQQADKQTYRDIDDEFHSLIHRGSHNEQIILLAEQLRMKTAPYGAAPFTMAGHDSDISVPHSQHVLIAKAILGRDQQAAHSHMVEHIATNSLTIRRILAEKALEGGGRRKSHSAA